MGEREDGLKEHKTYPNLSAVSGGPALRLLVMGEKGAASFTLPAQGDVTIGRARECTVRIDDPKLSRKHAILRVGSVLTLTDLGSANGTRVGNQTLASGEPVVIAPGDMLVFGSCVVLVQTTSASTRLRHIWSHGYFEARLEDECARAEQGGAMFSVLRLRPTGPNAPTAVEEMFAKWLRPIDIVATYSPSEYEVLLVESGRERAEELAEQMRAELDTRGVGLVAEIACYPRDGRTPEALIAHAGKVRRDPEGLGGAERSVVPTGVMQRMQAMIARVAAGQISVLVVGETGTGKEVLANAVHAMSPRANKPFLCLNCAALSEALLESELFGHERGAFTGALQAKAGLLESANGGTVFLDEVGEMPLTMQAKLLRVLEQRQVLRVGALTPRSIDVRFVSATNRDLEAEAARGTFRQDLYFRLNGILLVVPPLRERVDEIEHLTRTFITQFSNASPRSTPLKIAGDALGLLKRYRWPGNIRELRNVIERAVLLCEGDVISLKHLPFEKMGRTLPSRAPIHAPAPGSIAVPSMAPEARSTMSDEISGFSSRNTLAPDEPPDEITSITVVIPLDSGAARERIVLALDQCKGNQTEAAKLLGISRRTLVSRLGQYSLPRPRKPGGT